MRTAYLNMLQAIIIIFLFNYNMRIRADVFSAVTEFEYVFQAHKTIKDYLATYIKRHEKRLAVVKSYLNVFKKEHKKAMEDIPKYLENPVNMFTLIKRLTVDLNFIKYSIDDETVYIEDIINKQYADKYPTMEDLSGAAEALSRLQYVYNLEAKALAEGNLGDIDYSSPMTACDCYEIGRILYTNDKFVDGLKWMLEAYRKYNNEGYEFSDVDILEDISFGYFKTGSYIFKINFTGDLNNALYWVQKIYDIDPHNYRTWQIEQQCRNSMKYSRFCVWEPNMETKNKQWGLLWDTNEFFSLCRGEVELPIEISSRLTCRYQTENHPFTKLAPIKSEMLYLSPNMVLFHDMLSDREIYTLMEMAKPKLHRSRVNPTTISRTRISKTAWLLDNESDVVARISRRVIHMTGLSLDYGDDLQVANYGIAGYYDLHNDFFKCPQKDRGNRIATVLFYMSNVTQGGATIFPELGVSIFPVKGDAIFWLNLHPSGEGNDCMLHAACPVLTGSKWVATKWIYEAGQEFIKPCNLEYHEDCPDTYAPF